MSALQVILPNDDTQLFMEVTDKKIRAKFGKVYVEGRMDLGHDYPEYRPTLEAFSNVMSLDKKIILSSITPIQEILDSDDYNRVTIEVKDKKLRIYSDVSNFTYSKDVDFDGEYIVDVNGKILKKTIDSIGDDELILKFSDSNGVLIFDSKAQGNQSSLMTPVRRRKK
jgi:DNA polymerase III sliding clamp (beta) subunit (PCNA family)